MRSRYESAGILDEMTASFVSDMPAGRIMRRRDKHRSPEFSRDVLPFIFWGVVCAGSFFGGVAWVVALIFGLAKDTALAFVLMASMIGGGLAGIFIEVYTIGRYYGLFSQQDEIVGNLTPPEPVGKGESHYWQQPGTGSFVLEPREPRKGAMIMLMKALVFDKQSPTIETAKNCGYGRDDWADLREWWLEREWIRWRDEDNPRQGMYLTREGRAEFEGRIRKHEGQAPTYPNTR